MQSSLSQPTEKVIQERKRNELNRLLEKKAELSVQIIELQQRAVDLNVERSGIIKHINQLVLELNNGSGLRQGNVV